MTTHKITPPLPKLKPSENKKAIKIIENLKKKNFLLRKKIF